MQETLEVQVQSLGRKDPLEKGMATHTCVLAWRSPWTEESGELLRVAGLQSWTWLKRLSIAQHKNGNANLSVYLAMHYVKHFTCIVAFSNWGCGQTSLFKTL